MPFPSRAGGGGISRPTMTSSGSLTNPVVGDVWTIVTPAGVEYSDISMMQDRGAGPITLTLSGANHTVTNADIPPIGSTWPVTVRDIGITLVSVPISVSNPPQVPAAPTMGTATAGNATITAPYTDGSNGGAAITSHDAQLFDAAGNLITTVTGVANPAVLTAANGVVNGIGQKVKVRAVNSAGPGPYSAAFSNTVTPVFAIGGFVFQQQGISNNFVFA